MHSQGSPCLHLQNRFVLVIAMQAESILVHSINEKEWPVHGTIETVSLHEYFCILLFFKNFLFYF